MLTVDMLTTTGTSSEASYNLGYKVERRTTRSSPADSRSLLEQARKLEQLKPDWDGEGAPQINPDVLWSGVTLAYRVLGLLPDEGWLTPSTTGGVQVEWHRGRRRLALELLNPYLIQYLKWDSTCGVAEEDLISIHDDKAIASLARWFLADGGQ